jgi:hypothetical protein
MATSLVKNMEIKLIYILITNTKIYKTRPTHLLSCAGELKVRALHVHMDRSAPIHPYPERRRISAI